MTTTDRPHVYVAGPLSLGDQAMNIRAALDMADVLLAYGCAPYVPHLFFFWHFASPTSHTHDDWLALDLSWLDVSDAVLRMPGISPGADREEAHARTRGIPVLYNLGEVRRWLDSRVEVAAKTLDTTAGVADNQLGSQGEARTRQTDSAEP